MASEKLDVHVAYWLECLNCSLDELGIYNILTDEQKLSIAHDLQGGHENKGMAFGHDCIPNPLSIEIQQLKLRHKNELAEESSITEIYKNEACKLAGVNPKDVYINNGQVYRR